MTTPHRLTRRTFLASSAALGGVTAFGRAPAFAQGTKLHILRWVDFIPACDVELRTKHAVEASKLLGVSLEGSVG